MSSPVSSFKHLSLWALCSALLWQALPGHAATLSTSVAVGGAVVTAKTYDAAALQALPQVTQTDVFASGTSTQTHTYTGPTLWSVLNDAGIQTNAAIKNDVLNKVVLAIGTDGYKVVYSAGELSPNFGAEAALVAWGETLAGGSTITPLGSDGFARTTAPLDTKGGRYVSNLSSLQMLASASTQAATCASCISTSMSVSGDVLHGGSFDLAALKLLPAVTRTVGGNTYTGVSLWDFISGTVGLATDANVKNDVLDMYLVATGTDGYKATFSMGELNSAFGNQPDIIAYSMNGDDLTSTGFARLVAPNDVKAGRWVSNLASIEVFHATPAVPEPESLALVLTGLGLIAWRGARRG
jgi:DMSO/TMAO reductase YedYZ molybdopterin-dependent catalytic subunit